MATTRVVSGLWGGRLNGSFAGKTVDVPSTHPVGVLTRVVSGLYGGRRNGSFAGKASTEESALFADFIILARRFARR